MPAELVDHPPKTPRRYDVDWLRTLALGLLIIYHAVISFQPWARFVGFIQNGQSLEWLWDGMSLINIWRIPILFIISGMGVRFAMNRRDWSALLKDRAVRILLPYLFGFFLIAPFNIYFFTLWSDDKGWFIPNAGHLWFLGNIFVYVLVSVLVFYGLANRPKNPLFNVLHKLFAAPLGIMVAVLPLMLEGWLFADAVYSIYAETAHGFWLGLVCFWLGFLFISVSDSFWPAVERHRWLTLAIAFSLYLVRLLVFEFDMQGFNWLIGLESGSWMLAIFGFGARHLNRGSAILRYLSVAVYPIYILHLPIQYGLSLPLFPLALPPAIKLLLLVTLTLAICLFLYEIIRRIKPIRPLFGLKSN